MTDFDGLLAKSDPDRRMAALFAPPAIRGRLFAIYAFYHEIARVPDSVSEAMIGEMRLAWAREAVADLFADPPKVRRHDIYEALSELRQAPGAPDRETLETLVEARAADLGEGPFPTKDDRRDYVDRTAVTLMRAAAKLCKPDLDLGGEAGAAIHAAGRLWGFTGLARAFPALCQAGRPPFSADELAGALTEQLAPVGVAIPTFLIENAVKYTEEGSITLRTYQHGDRARIEVEDTGIGISNDFLPYVFDEFAQESTGDSRAYDGIGVGLAIARGLVEEMGGTISVKSHKGSGSTFAVELPASEIAEPDHADVLPAEADEGEHPRVLVVEDQPDTAYIMAGLLGSNFRTELAAGAEEALELARRNAYDVVLLDINLGAGRSGSDVLRELRERPEYESVPVIACTAYALDGDRERFLSEGFDAYIAKPVRRQALHEIVDEVLQAARQSI